MERNKILLAEDDPNLGKLLSEFLNAKGYETTLARDGEEALQTYATGRYHLVILDVMMPLRDGFSVAKEIRKKDLTVPMIFLTARSMKEDTLEGFRSGGDDYLTKPFSMEELLMRMQAILRRTRGDEIKKDEITFKIGSFEFDSLRETLLINTKVQKLTSKEAALLKLLCQHKNETLERSAALKEVWGDDSYFNSRSMDVYITKLRKYLKEDPAVEIANVHGRGFRLIETPVL